VDQTRFAHAVERVWTVSPASWLQAIAVYLQPATPKLLTARSQRIAKPFRPLLHPPTHIAKSFC